MRAFGHDRAHPKGFVIAGTLAAVLLASPALLTGPTAGAQTPTTADEWTVDLSEASVDGVNLARQAGAVTLLPQRDPRAPADPGSDQRPLATYPDTPMTQGMAVLEPYTLQTEVNRVAPVLDAHAPEGSTVAVDIRGERAPGQWTEWVPANADTPAVLPEAVRTVQARLYLAAREDAEPPSVRSLRLVADLMPTSRPAPEARGENLEDATHRVFATREGLVGGTTANGHVIVERDQFVALPSRRGLSPEGTGDYTVQVCADNGRCAWVPVWDVGPWNINDDYWNPSQERQAWQDLPMGLPQAQAAFQNGYNGGLDGFGRQVRNPAGIDLADGTFWDALQLHDNAWIDATYLWQTDQPLGTVQADSLVVYSEPDERSATVGFAAHDARVPILEETTSTPRARDLGQPQQWLRIGPSHYVVAGEVDHTRS